MTGQGDVSEQSYECMIGVTGNAHTGPLDRTSTDQRCGCYGSRAGGVTRLVDRTGPHPSSCGKSSLATRRTPGPASEGQSTVCDMRTLLLLLAPFSKSLASSPWWVRRSSSVTSLGLPLLLPLRPLLQGLLPSREPAAWIRHSLTNGGLTSSLALDTGMRMGRRGHTALSGTHGGPARGLAGVVIVLLLRQQGCIVYFGPTALGRLRENVTLEDELRSEDCDNGNLEQLRSVTHASDSADSATADISCTVPPGNGACHYLLRGAALDLTLRVAGPHSRHPHIQDKWAQAVT